MSKIIDPEQENFNKTGNILGSQYEIRDISNNLSSLRKQYDQICEKNTKIQKAIQKTRHNIDKQKSIENQLIEEKKKFDNKLANCKHLANDTKEKQKKAVLDKSTYIHMIKRMKHDKISYQLQIQKLDSTLKRIKTQNNRGRKEFFEKNQLKRKAMKMLDKLMISVETQHSHREKKLMDFKETIRHTQAITLEREKRETRLQKIAEFAAGDSAAANQKKWMSLYHVHQFLNVFLKRKMEREMKKYEIVEKAFHKIKGATGLSDSKEIVKKFITKEETYNKLLISIAQYERKIDFLRKETNELKSDLKGITQECNILEVKIPEEKTKYLSNKTEFVQLNEDHEAHELVHDKLYNWVIRMLQKWYKVVKGDMGTRLRQLYAKDQTFEAFKLLMEETQLQVDSSNQDETFKQILNQMNRYQQMDDSLVGDQYLMKNIRVEKKSFNEKTFSKDTFGDSKRYSQEGDSAYSDEDQDGYDENEEQKYIRALRKQDAQLIGMVDEEDQM